MDLTQYLLDRSGASSILQLSAKSGVPPHKLHNQLTGRSTLTLDMLYQLATGLGIDFLDIAVKADLIDAAEAQKMRGHASLQAYTDENLINELHRRLQAGSRKIAEANSPFAQPDPSKLAYHIGAETPDGREFRPDLYQSDKMLFERYGQNWRKHYTLAAKKQVAGDDIDEPYS